MPCFDLADIPVLGPLLPPVVTGNITIPMIGAMINAYASYLELDLFKEHKGYLDFLTDENMDIGRSLKAKGKEVEELREQLNELTNVEPECEPCCDDAKLSVYRALSSNFKQYQRDSEQLHHSQVGISQLFQQRALDSIPQAIATVAESYQYEYDICDAIGQDYLRTVTTSAYRGEAPNPNILAGVASTRADSLNDSSALFSNFLSTAFRGIGRELETNRIAERQVDDATQVGLRNTFDNNRTIPLDTRPTYIENYTPSAPVSVFGDSNET